MGCWDATLLSTRCRIYKACRIYIEEDCRMYIKQRQELVEVTGDPLGAQRRGFAGGGVEGLDIPPADIGVQYTHAPSVEAGGAMNPGYPSPAWSWNPTVAGARSYNPGYQARQLAKYAPGAGR